MKNNLLLTLFVLMFLIVGNKNVFGQSQTHELGLRFTGLGDFDFIYKKGKNENEFTRYRLGATNIGFQKTTNNKNFNFSFGFAIGSEKRKNISERLHFIHGFEPTLSFTISVNDDNYNMNIRPGIGYVLGFQYDISEKFYVNIESIPTLSGSFLIDIAGFNDNYDINAGFNSNASALSLVYKFKKNE